MKLKTLFGLLVCASAIYAADPRIEQGAIFASKGEYEKALGEYRAILAENPKASDAYFAAAEVRVKMKDYSGALANYKLAYRFTPTMSEAYEGAAKVYEILGDKKKAEAERAKDPKNAPAPEETVETAEAPVTAPAAPAVEPAEEAKPVPPPPAPVVEEPKPAKAEAPKEAVKEVAKPEPKQEETPKATTAEPKQEEKFSYDGPLFQKGKKLFQEKKYAEAGAVWRDILKQQPGNPGAYYYAGAGRYELGEMDKAEFNLKRAFDYPEFGYNAHFYLSLIYKKQNKKNLEIAELKEYIKGTPSAEGKKKAQARIDELEGKNVQTKEAAVSSSLVASSSSIVEKKVAEPAKAEEPAKIETPKADEPKQEIAKAEAKPVVKQEIPAGPATVESANIYFAQGNLSAALAAYKEVLEGGLTDDDHAFVLLQMGNIYRERRDFRLAVSRYREVVENYPDTDWASEAERAWKDAVWQENHSNQLPRKK